MSNALNAFFKCVDLIYDIPTCISIYLKQSFLTFSMSNTIPEVPGQVVDSQYLKELRSRVKELVGVSNFPGAQPISFRSEHLQELLDENYFVCEKTDGLRVFVYITSDNSGQRVYLIDRRNYYRYVPNLFFPVPDDPTFSQFHHETLIDGELVNDKESDGTVIKIII
ncbi:hypothetical protein RclHR1_14600001 [Rhizophagus clarus]|uniref:mRNA capping enzyme adenylation domain-containing protein n=1 Tax=Rhizophagus clarus TaxID=94130 RepID=A0A2Z6QSH1_9GLOM|nr:hypothetical protein RclHR1_14600001 [Rhizophagus clarus]